jgi:flagellar hook-associated protein 2
LTDAGGILSEKEGSSSDSSVIDLTAASNASVAGTHTVVVNNLAATSSGALTEITNATDTLSGKIVIKVGTSGTTQTISLTSSNNTLSGLASSINNAGMGVTASVLTDETGSRLSLVSATSGTAADLSVTSQVVDTASSTTLGYQMAVAGADASLVVDGISLTTSSNTVTNLIPGLTFQLLSTAPGVPVQIVIGNYNSGVESTVNSLVTDYNSLISAMNAQFGLDSSGNPEPLFGSPTLSLLQQNILGGINLVNPNGYLTAVSATNGTTLTGSLVIQEAGGFNLNYTGIKGTTKENSTDTGTTNTTSTGTLTGIAHTLDTLSGSLVVQVGSATANTITLSSDNTLTGLKSAINAASIGVTASIVTTDGVSSLKLVSNTAGAAGSMVVTSSVMDTRAQTIAVPTTSSNNNLSGLAATINAANIGVTAGIATSNGLSTLTLASQNTGSKGVLTVNSAVTASSPTSLAYNGSTYTSTTQSSGTLGSVASNGSDILTGSVVIEVGTGTAQTITLNSTNNTISKLANAIQALNLGLTASVITSFSGSNTTESISLVSNVDGAAGVLTVTPDILDTTTRTTNSITYTNSSDIASATGLGISVNNDGTLSLDVDSLDSVLNSDFSGVQSLFQNANSWGANFASILTNSGTSSTSGVLALALTSDSSIESTLNADISRENLQISSESKSLTAELNSANQIMQELPSQLSGVNELYSAITGYNQSSVG